MVTTQRVAQATVDTQNANKVTKYVPSIAVSNKPSQETFKFWQWMTYFDQNGQIRNPADLVHPTISYLDLFKLEEFLKLSEKDKRIMLREDGEFIIDDAEIEDIGGITDIEIFND
jgi:hypothetical protein